MNATTGLTRGIAAVSGRLPAALLLVLAALPAVASDPPPAFGVCLACHTVSPGASSREGPNLHGVMGRIAGVTPGFVFSAAMQGSGITWTPEELDRFIAAPSARVPGTSMIFIGVDEPAERREIIDYLKTAR